MISSALVPAKLFTRQDEAVPSRLVDRYEKTLEEYRLSGHMTPRVALLIIGKDEHANVPGAGFYLDASNCICEATPVIVVEHPSDKKQSHPTVLSFRSSLLPCGVDKVFYSAIPMIFLYQ